MKGLIFTVKDMDIATGDVKVVLLNAKDAAKLDLHPMDRILITKGKKSTVAILDIAESSKAVAPGKIGLFEEVLDSVHAKNNGKVSVKLAKKPESIKFIRKKLDGFELSKDEISMIVKDIVNDELTSVELTSYVTASYTKGMTVREMKYLTDAMMRTGSIIKFANGHIIDLHCIGGVPGNRTTLIVVPILIAAGLKVPKTSSRAITSPAGTADTMEVLCNVTIPVKKLKKILHKVGGFIIWGGSVNLAPSDEKIIAVESPLSIDAVGQMVASILAKKASVSATHLYVDIPVGEGAKISSRKKALSLKKLFSQICKYLGIKIKTVLTDGSHPIGNGIGPCLEARDCLWILLNDSRGPEDLKRKSIRMAGEILEFAGKAKKGKGEILAKRILESGAAYKKMKAIIKAQGGKAVNPENLFIGKYNYDVCAGKKGIIKHMDNVAIAKIARLAGSPGDIGAGIYINKHRGDNVKTGDVVYTIISENQAELEFGIEKAKEFKYGFTIE